MNHCRSLALLAALITTPTASAETLHVPADYPTLQSCIDAAVSGEDECVVAPGTYNELINFLGKAITVRSSHGPELTIIDATGMNNSVVSCVSGEGPDTVLWGFTITGGTGSGDPRRGGGLHLSAAQPSIADCVFEGNTAEFGGGVYSSTDYQLRPTLVRCAFHLNTAYHGGGMYNMSPDLIVSECAFTENLAYRGGAIYNGARPLGFEDKSVSIDRCFLADNRALWNGGAIYNYESGRPIVIDSRFLDNSATNGGGIFNFAASPVVSRCVFQGNSASDAGGGMRNLYYSTPEMINCTFDGNTANTGGGVHNEQESNPFIYGCSFIRNTATTKGGGLYSVNSATSVFRSSFHGNRAEQGGAVYDDMPRTNLGVFSSTFVGNSAAVGRAVHLDTRGGYGYLDNCTFSANSAIRGGALYNRDYGLILENCILWNDQPEEIATEQTAGGSLSYSDFMGDLPTRLSDAGGNIEEDPRFTRLPGPGGDGAWGTADDDYGDLHLRTDSPCINAGDSPPLPAPSPYRSDLDGHPRVLCGQVDMGAYEFGIGDFNCDQVVDLTDFAAWETCMTDPLPHGRGSVLQSAIGTRQSAIGCEAFDFDADLDVDLADFAGWQRTLAP